MADPLEALRMIAADMEQDAREFDGRPFTGATVAEYMGNHGAAIAAVANILALHLAEHDPDRHCIWVEID